MRTVKAEDANQLVDLVSLMRKSEELYKETRLMRHNIYHNEYKKKVDKLINDIKRNG